MKKKIILITLILLMFTGIVLFAESNTDKQIAIKTVLIEKIYSHSNGYKVLYRKSGYGFGSFYVPMRWFKLPAGTKEDPAKEEKAAGGEEGAEKEKASKQESFETDRGSMSGAKAQIIWGRKATYPYATLVYMDKEFSHIKLYLQQNIGHKTWGVLPVDKEFEEEFSVTELFLEY